MSIPREGSRDIGDGLIVSTCPDVCKTPVGAATPPIPYSIYARQNDTASAVATTVFQTSDRSHKLGSEVTTCHGDEPGTATGVKSGTVGSVCTPKTYSATVRIEGKNAVRHDDEWWMNNRNTVGRLVYVRDTRVLSDADPMPLRPGDQLAYNDVTGAYTGTQAPPTTAPGAVTGAAGRLNALLGLGAAGYAAGDMAGQYYVGQDGVFARSLGDTLTSQTNLGQRAAANEGLDMPYFGQTAQVDFTNDLLSIKTGQIVDFRQMTPEQLEDLVRQPWPSPAQVQQNARRVRAQKQERAASTANVRVSRNRDRPCNVGPYRNIRNTCEPGYQAHHIVPDYTLRYGTRAQGEAGLNRIDGMPSFGDGPAICLQGNAADDGSEHWEAHGVDASIAQLGVAGSPPGTTPIGPIITMSTEQVVRIRRECEKEIRAATETGFAGTDRSTLARTTIMPPVAGSPQFNALSTQMRPGGRY